MGIRRPSLTVNEARRLSNGSTDLPLAGGRAVQGGRLVTSPVAHILDGRHATSTDLSITSRRLDNRVLAPETKSASRAGAAGQVNENRPVKKAHHVGNDIVSTLDATAATRDIGYSDTLAAPWQEHKHQVFISAPAPAPKVSPAFDILTEQYRPAKALQMVLRRAMKHYAAMLADGTFKTAPLTYPISQPGDDGPYVQTSRIMPLDVLEIARDHLDPLRLESQRAFGRKLACAALAAYFAAERRGNS